MGKSLSIEASHGGALFQVRLISFMMLLTGALCLLGAFMTYTLLAATSVQDSGLGHTRQGIAVSVCVCLFFSYTILGLGVGALQRWAWHHLKASAVVLVMLGLYTLFLWLRFAPEMNGRIVSAGHMQLAEVSLAETIIISLTALFMVVLPLLTIAMISSDSVRQQMSRGDAGSLEARSSAELWLVWGCGGSAVMVLLGALFDNRQLGIGDYELAIRVFWIGMLGILCFSLFAVYLRKLSWRLTSSLFLLALGVVMAVELFSQEGVWFSRIGEAQRLILSSLCLYIAVVLLCWMLLVCYQQLGQQKAITRP